MDRYLIDRNSQVGRALLALRDCGAITVRLGNVPAGYQRLQREKAVTAKRVSDSYAIVRLTDLGKMWVANLTPWNPRYE